MVAELPKVARLADGWHWLGIGVEVILFHLHVCGGVLDVEFKSPTCRVESFHVHGFEFCLVPCEVDLRGEVIDEGEFPIIEAEGVSLYTASDVRRRGHKSVVDEVLDATRGKKIHLSFDVDSIFRDDFPATGYALEGSLRYETVRAILEAVVHGADDISSIDVVEYNPRLDADGSCLKRMLDIFSVLTE